MMTTNKIFREKILETHSIARIMQWLNSKYNLKTPHKNNDSRNDQQSKIL